MTTVDAHLSACLAGVRPIEPLDLHLLEAQGCTLVEDVVATHDLPPFDSAELDGYAVRLEDVASATPSAPVTLPVVGDVYPGDAPTVSVQPGFCARVLAGGPLPVGTEAFIPVEWTDAGIARVEIRHAGDTSTFVHYMGADARAHQVLVRRGTRLGAGHMGLLAAAGRERVAVRPRPRVVVLATGRDLSEPGVPLRPGHVSDATTYVLTSAARDAGADAYRVGIVSDEPRVLLDTIEDQLVRADAVVLAGRVGIGSSGALAETLSRLGQVELADVAMAPTGLQGRGAIGPDATPFFLLPIDPVSAFVAFEIFVGPCLRRMLDVSPVTRQTVRGRLVGDIASVEGRRDYVRAKLSLEQGHYVVHPLGADRSALAGLAETNSFVIVPDAVTHLAAGSTVEVMVLERRRT